MITEQKLAEGVSLLRFLTIQDGTPYPPYNSTCILIWENKEVVWVWGMCGEFPRARLVGFLHFVAKQGAKTIRATRDSSRRLPRGRLHSDGSTSVDVGFWLDRYPIKE